MDALLKSPLIFVIMIGILIFIGVPFIILIKILNKLLRYFDRFEKELRRLTKHESN